MRTATRTIAPAALALSLLAAGSASASSVPVSTPAALGSVALVAAPGTPKADIAPHGAWLEPSVAAGTSHIVRVAVENNSSAATTVGLSPIDGIESPSGGGAVYSGAGGTATWLSVPVSTLTLAPHATRVIPVAVSVPAGAAPGQHLAGVSATLPTSTQPVSPTDHGHNRGSFVVHVQPHVVLAVEVVVPGHAALAVAATPPRFRRGPLGVAQIVSRVTDVGGLLGHVSMSVTLAGRTVSAPVGTLVPGGSTLAAVDWPAKLATGERAVRACVTGADLVRPVCHEATVRVTAGTHTASEIAAASHVRTVIRTVVKPAASHSLVLFEALAALLAAALVALGAIALRARRRAGEAPVRGGAGAGAETADEVERG